jgi:hypothetical protein
MRHVYHYTCSAQLPFIIVSGELRLEGEIFAGCPAYLWATANPNDEPTASGHSPDWEDTFREGSIARVRLTLDADHFKPWPQVRAKGKNTRWKGFFEGLDTCGREAGSNPDDWWCRRQPLPLRKVIAAHTMVNGEAWTPYDIGNPDMCGVDDFRAVRIGDKAYGAIQSDLPDGRRSYRIMMPIDVKAADEAVAP